MTPLPPPPKKDYPLLFFRIVYDLPLEFYIKYYGVLSL